MSVLVEGILAQCAGQLALTGSVAQNNFTTVAKVCDYDFMENRRLITLEEAVGVREVTAKVTPGGPYPASV